MKKFTDESRKKNPWVWSVERIWESFVDQRAGYEQELAAITHTEDIAAIEGSTPYHLAPDLIEIRMSVELPIVHRALLAVRDTLPHLNGHYITWWQQYDRELEVIDDEQRKLNLTAHAWIEEGRIYHASGGVVHNVEVGVLLPTLILSANIEIIHEDNERRFIFPYLFDSMFEIDIKD